MKLMSEDAIKIGDKLFLFGRDVNVLFTLRLNDGQIRILGKIPEEHAWGKRLICKLISYENQLILAPLKAHSIWIYKLDTYEWVSVAVQPYENNYAKSYFRNVTVQNKKVLFWGAIIQRF